LSPNSIESCLLRSTVSIKAEIVKQSLKNAHYQVEFGDELNNATTSKFFIFQLKLF